MPVMNLVQAVNEGLRQALNNDDRVVLLGEDVGKFGGVFRATAGLYDDFPDRIFDTPLNESGIMGTAIGMALYGLRPVPEIQFADFSFPAFDQIVNEAAKYRYRSGGEYTAPMVIRMPCGGGIKGGHYHSQSPEGYYAHTPGLVVVMPSSPHDAKGLLLSAIHDNDDPVIFLEPKRIYRAAKGEVPAGDYRVPLGKAQVVRSGQQVTIISYGATLHTALEAAEEAAKEGFDCEVIDLRTLIPLDIETVVQSVCKTGRTIIVHEAPRTCGYGAELAALIAEKCFLYLEAPVQRVTGFDTPFPYTLEKEYLPDVPRILNGVRQAVHF